MSDDNLREALQGMRQPQPGIVYIADVLAYVEPRLAEVHRLSDRCEHLRQMLETTAIERGEFRNDRERARDAAVFLEQENARLTEHLGKVGAIHNGCPNTNDDVPCPWCRIAELEQEAAYDDQEAANYNTGEAPF